MNKYINRIKVLPEFVVNQIAAGEVVDRPASILKELVENSIDANSTVIRIYLENGGISSIKVVDNGHGIHPEDLPLVFLQHATSKITAASELANINSLGFRGEALASIASVAKTTIVSKQQDQQGANGTTIEVKDLFYNTPARHKFLRSSKTEFNYTQEIFKRIALSNFSVGFILYHNNKLIKNLSSCAEDIVQKEKRLTKLCGKKFVDNATFFSVVQNGLELSGWISSSVNMAGCSVQYFYINDRMVKDKLLSGAIRQVTQKLSLPQAYCLYIKLDPILVDVNVHPTKQEVRFREPKIIYSFVYENILEVLTGKSSINNLLYSDNIACDISENMVIESKKLASAEFIDHNITQANIKLFSMFNNRYIIFERESLEIIFLCVPIALKWLLEKKLQQINLLSSYQLIIPERIKIDNIERNENKDNLDLYIKLLENFKFTVDQIHEDILLIRAIPYYLNLLKIEINYKNFLLEFLQIKPALLGNLNNLEIIKLIIKHINVNQYILYTKNDLIFLITELTKEHFGFSVWSEQQFSKLISS